MLGIKKISINYQDRPTGVGCSPQFGWILTSNKSNVFQTAFQLQLSEHLDFSFLAYDSLKVFQEESAHVFAPGFSPKPLTRYFVRVKVWDNYGEESSYSQPSSFVTSNLNKNWSAHFITAQGIGEENLSKGYYLRKEFIIKKPVKAAWALTTAQGLYEFYINGQKAGNDQFAPGWTSYKKRLLYEIRDIKHMLKPGKNAAGALIGSGWFKSVLGPSGRRCHYGDTAAFSAEICIAYADGTEEVFFTDHSWKGHDSPILFSEIYDGETYDSRLELPGWNLPEFEDTDWNPVRCISPGTKNILPHCGCSVQEIEAVPAKELFTTPSGETVIDFGQNMAGWVHITADGKSGDTVSVQHFEVLDSQGNPYLDNLRTAKQLVTYICNGSGPAEYHPHFSFQGFRYIRINSCPGPVLKENFTAYAVHSQMEETGTFSCSNPDLNKLQHNIKWGLKSNFLDIPTDCPQRDERLGWTGDAQVFCATASYLMNTYSFFSKWLDDLALDQKPDGGVPHIAPLICFSQASPEEEDFHSAAAWADAAVIIPWTLYQAYGDKEILRKQYDSMKAWIEFMKSHYSHGTWNYKQQFGDWLALDAQEGSYHGATPDQLICTAYFALSARLFASSAKALGRQEDYKTYNTLYHRIKTDYKTYFMKDGHITAFTQTAQIISLFFDLVPHSCRENVISDLLSLLKQHQGHLVTGFVGTPYFCHALTLSGHTKEAYQLILKEDFPSWLYQVKMGATTIWEHWNGKRPDGSMWSADMNSFNHYAYGAVGEWLYRTVAGIQCHEEGPGYKQILICPHIGGGLSFAESSYESVYGTIKSRWEDHGTFLNLQIQIPHNTRAVIRLEQAVRIIEADGLDFKRENLGLAAETGSGKYSICCEIAR